MSDIRALLKEIQQERITLGLNLSPHDRHFPAPINSLGFGKRDHTSISLIKGRYDLLVELENRIMAGKYD